MDVQCFFSDWTVQHCQSQHGHYGFFRLGTICKRSHQKSSDRIVYKCLHKVQKLCHCLQSPKQHSKVQLTSSSYNCFCFFSRGNVESTFSFLQFSVKGQTGTVSASLSSNKRGGSFLSALCWHHFLLKALRLCSGVKARSTGSSDQLQLFQSKINNFIKIFFFFKDFLFTLLQNLF